jgi:hypothetical protein
MGAVCATQPRRRCRTGDGRLGELGGRQAVALAPAVLGLLRTLYGRDPHPFQTLNFKYGTEQRPHADAVHFNTEPLGLMCGVWVAMEDIDADCGPLVKYPGSHKLPYASPSEVGIEIDPGQETSLTRSTGLATSRTSSRRYSARVSSRGTRRSTRVKP